VSPDTAIIQTHRNPVEVVKSQIRLTQVLEAMFARPRPREQLAMSEARKIEQMLGYITRFRDAYPNVARQFIDVNYRELVSDPLAVVRRIYERLDIRLSVTAAERMRRLASARSHYKKGRHDRTAMADLGIDCAAEKPRFEEYCSRFGISFQKTELPRSSPLISLAGVLPRRRSFSHSFRPFTKTKSPGSLIERAVGFEPNRCGNSYAGHSDSLGVVIKLARLFCKERESDRYRYPPLFIA
jgi:Sulfotransferase family